MSKTTWLKEFYPIPADKCRAGIPAIKHSLRKWEGALPENLKKHKLAEVPIEYSLDTCSLCARYYDDGTCESCPIYKTIGRDCERTFRISVARWIASNPAPMIKLLKKTLEFYQDKRKKPVAKKEKSK